MGKKASSASHPGVFNRFARTRCVRTRSAVEWREWAWTDSAMSGCGVGRRPVRTHQRGLCTHPRGGMCQSPCPMRTCRNAWADACRAARPIPVSLWHASPSAAAHALGQMRLEQRDIAVLTADLDDPVAHATQDVKRPQNLEPVAQLDACPPFSMVTRVLVLMPAFAAKSAWVRPRDLRTVRTRSANARSTSSASNGRRFACDEVLISWCLTRINHKLL